ncbi:sigma-70 family RNA polymerase sigma factor [Amycolatopsis suaedae]|uniref:RNA polymerase sigma factor n=1 Tax=Amycolatopsis suaedae TaxID=2510978 RepID=A0A4Q7J235_9PSEU|nr:sigma-70 family RNA polymerase sigma factor [Amycolatopsis suaedae]RZQ60576.1 sigma-70 family RNA polymerase sigma factor [Amycolatopsis suaedae]
MTTSTVGEEFLTRADPFRGELLAHCYRMLGSVHDAEDLVQETYVRAWRSYEAFEGRSSLRTWLYRIATNVCLTALESRGRRPLPSGLGGPSEPGMPLVEQHDVPWLEPVPDALVGDAADPAAVVTARESVRLALVVALQQLPPRQRAVLILRDVLAWRAAEVAELLETTVASVNSALQRARGRLAELSAAEDGVSEPDSPEQRELLDRYVTAMERKDVGRMVALFTADAVWEMPPFTAWYSGPERITRHLEVQCPAGPDDQRLLPVRANGQPGFALYLRAADGVFRPFTLQVLTVRDGVIARVVNFFDLRLFSTFGVPDALPPGTPAHAPST